MNKHDRMMEQIAQHGRNLDVIFPNAKKHGVDLCKALRRWEVKASGITLAMCNEPTDPEVVDTALDAIEDKVKALLGDEGPIILNRDPRGYALKVNLPKEARIYRDWGGYGILAPDFRE